MNIVVNMRFNRSKFIIALVCVSFGWIVGFYMGRTSGLRTARHSLFSMGPFSFNMPFSTPDDGENMFGQEDSFELRDLLKESPDIYEKWFKRHQGFDNSATRFFTAHEDDNFIYYEFDAADFDKDTLSVKVENGMIIVEGEKNSNSFGATFKSKIYKTFPIPPNVNEDNVQLSNEGSKIIVKFPKHGV